MKKSGAKNIPIPQKRTCPGCGRDNQCQRVSGHDDCWCENLPKLMALKNPSATCLCQKCLEKTLSAKTSKPRRTSRR
ncbi:MAG: cysteine-rich CWC family protein [Elusimicrobia bacterium]|nr:cysteine-rich CWC family protein [Elusimicrobiota bacterium]